MSRPDYSFDKNQTIVRARELRRSMSLPEGLLWQQLRTRPGGLKFRRQHPLGPYIADFFCPAAKLVIEVDGESHRMGNRPKHDGVRDKWFEEQGLRVVRFAATDVLNDLESVLRAVTIACRA